MKKKTVKFTSAVLSVVLLLGVCTFGGCAKNETETEVAQAEKIMPAAETDSAAVSGGTGVPEKDETVYVISSADGTPQKVLVSSWLKNPDRNAELKDVTTLRDIENVKGTEEFTREDGQTLLWDAAGSDIYYQGTSDQDLPVEVKITYTLDGKKITPEELAGRSGKVTIRFDYINRESRKIRINGKQEKIYVPFAAASGTILDPEVFRNVEVQNGQLENIGNGLAVIGFAFPGMQENLNLDRKTLEIPDFIEIAADVQNFKMGPAMTVATASLLGGLDSENLDVQELRDQAKKLTDGMNQLLDGAGQLYDGLDLLLEQTGVLSDGVSALAAGSTRLKTGTDTLTAGVGEMQAGAGQLSAGLTELNSHSRELNSGAEQVFCTLLSAATAQLQEAGLPVPALTIGNYAGILNNLIASLDPDAVYASALQKVTAGVEAHRDEVKAGVTAFARQNTEAEAIPQVTAAVQEKVAAAVQAKETDFRATVIFRVTGLDPETYQQAAEIGRITEEEQKTVEAGTAAAMKAAVSAQMESEEIQAVIAAETEKAVNEAMASQKVQMMIKEGTEAKMQEMIADTMASRDVQAQLQSAAEGAKSVIALKTSLDSYNGFYLGLQSYTGGVGRALAGSQQLMSGVQELQTGAAALAAGTEELNAGAQTINGKMPELREGVTALRDGSDTLKAGLTKLMNEGIQKIADLAEEDLTDLTARLSACIEAGQSYTDFSGRAPEAEGTVKFIYKTDSIQLKSEN